MGIIKTGLILALPISGGLTYLSFRLGRELPVACRGLGQSIGMGYNYFKVILRFMAPQDNNQSARLVDVYRQTTLQTSTLGREIGANYRKVKGEARQLMPTFKDPMDALGIPKDKPIDIRQFLKKEEEKEEQEEGEGMVSGSLLLRGVEQERRRLVQKKKEQMEKDNFYNRV